MLRPVDIVMLLRLTLQEGKRPTFARLASDLSLYPSEVYKSVERAQASHLLRAEGKEHHVQRSALLEFLLHGIRYAFPAVHGGIVRGTPTGYAAPPLNQIIVAGSDPVPVWPFAEGTVRGYTLEPLHKNAPEMALKSPELYELLALVDAVRDGRIRERNLAAEELSKRLRGANAPTES
jgi:hypothetical protein